MAQLDLLSEFCPKDPAEWRGWLRRNHATAPGIWLVFFKKASGKQGLRYAEAVEEALCWGWIDSKVQSLDEESFRQVFTRRNPTSVWSAVNKRKVDALIREGRMRPPGLAAIELAKGNGAWESLDAVEALELPEDLKRLFTQQPEVAAKFHALAKSKRKGILYWLLAAKRSSTRETRLAAIATSLEAGNLPGPLA
ncbi:MAG: YdeI/OmpD-associated family protein [Bryobacterales bacterium]|nr:YdeI/OmpD-associated family protein [Bryobacterales bacterium]